MWSCNLILLAALMSTPCSHTVGVASIDVTPDYPIRLNGFGFRRTESAGIRQRLWAKAMAISDIDSEKHPTGAPAVMIVVDTLGIPDALHREVAARLAPFGVRPERLSIVATHTHTAPMVNRVSPTLFGQPIPAPHQAHIDRYSDFLRERICDAAVAVEARLEVQLPQSSGLPMAPSAFLCGSASAAFCDQVVFQGIHTASLGTGLPRNARGSAWRSTTDRDMRGAVATMQSGGSRRFSIRRDYAARCLIRGALHRPCRRAVPTGKGTGDPFANSCRGVTSRLEDHWTWQTSAVCRGCGSGGGSDEACATRSGQLVGQS